MKMQGIFKIVLAGLLVAGLAQPAAAVLQKGQQAPQIKVTTTSGQQVTLNNYKGYVLVMDFFATWCAPCKAIAPTIDAIAEEYDGRIKVGKVNVDDSPATPGKYGVRGIPTIILFKDGKVVDQVVGAVPKAQLEALIKKAL